MENELENQDSTKPEDEDTSSKSDVEIQEGDTDEQKVAKLDEANKRLFARAKKAEEELKALKTSSKAEAEKPKPEPKPQREQPVGDLDKVIEEKLNERDLASMDLSDELKSEVRAYAKAKGITYREAVKSDYINFFKEKEAEKIRADNASATTKGIGIKAKRDFGNLSESDIANLSDEEFAEYKKWLKS